VHEGYLTEEEAQKAEAKPLGLDYHPTNHTEGLAPYFRAVLKGEVKKILANMTKADGTAYDINRDGLKIYTTIDANMQLYAEEAQREWMRKLQQQFNAEWKGVKLSARMPNYNLRIEQGMHESDRYRQLKLEGQSDEEIEKNFNTPDNVNIFTWKGNLDTLMKPIDSVVYCQMLLRNAMMSMDPITGHIKAWVGGINFEHFKYDQVKDGARQVGSTAKPFTYAKAIENGYSPCMQVNNVPITIHTDGSPDWTPGSSLEETVPGMITLRTALARSQNWVTAYVMNEVTPEPVANLIKDMGIHTPVLPYPSICLGAFEATVMDMTGAYSVFANHGIWTEPTYLLRIEDKNGNVIFNYTPKVKQVMNEEVAYVMIDMLKSVITEGTGWRLRGTYKVNAQIAGKTGTTNDNSDGWFMGVTPQLVTGVWTGCEKRDFHFRSTHTGQGANAALPVFALYMQKVYADPSLGIKKDIDFDLPKKPLTTTLNCSVYSQEQKGTNEVEKKLGFQ
jgi:penicillin-binding protein 1A